MARVIPILPAGALVATKPAPRTSAPVGSLLTTLPPLSLYIHVPWCVKKCPYCDFNSHQAPSVVPEDQYLDALQADLEQALPSVWGRQVHTVFIGGGTPSLLSEHAMDRLLSMLRAHLNIWPDAEITLEANPTSVELGKLRAFREAGVNRVSLGVQALSEDALRFLGRRHDSSEAIAALELARKTFPRVSFDMIYARPGQSEAAWRAELRQALALAADHLSLYQLTIEPGTRFATEYARGAFALPEGDEAARLYFATAEEAAGFGLAP